MNATRFTDSLSLTRLSFSLVLKHPKLMLWPLLSTLLCIGLLTLIMKPIHGAEHLTLPLSKMQIEHLIILYGLLLLLLFFSHLIIFFFNCALTFNINQISNREKPNMLAAFRLACKRLGYLYLWDNFASTAGLFLSLIPPTSKWVRLVPSEEAQIPWTLASYFAIPVITDAGRWPREVLKTSSRLIAHNWGHVNRANFGFLAINILARIIGLIPLAVGLYMGGEENIIFGLIITVLIFLTTAVINTSTRAVVCAVLYQYANHRSFPRDFPLQLLEKAFILLDKKSMS